MTCRAPMLGAVFAVIWDFPPPKHVACTAPAQFAVVLPESEGLQITVTVCATHAGVLASKIEDVRLIKRRT